LPASDLLPRLEAVLREAGGIASGYFKRPLRQWTKDDHSPVTEADIAIDTMLRERLTALDPSAAWLSEETEDDLARLGVERLWIADPIDGTRAFLRGTDDWCISVALVTRQRPVLGGLYAPRSDEMFLAVAGGGATRNGRKLLVNDGENLAGARIAGPMSEIEKLKTLEPRLQVPFKVHSLALRLARVAEGTIDIALASTKAADWDLAAADLLVHEAQGTLTTLTGHRLSYNRTSLFHGEVCAAGPMRHRSLLAMLARHGSIGRTDSVETT
jgi:myo-inositol-1(or 4)-monophosphatase